MAIDVSPPRPAAAGAGGVLETPAPRSGRFAVGLVLGILVLAGAAAATGVLAARGASTIEMLAPVGFIGGLALVALASVQFEWFVLVMLALRTAMDATKLQPSGTRLASTVTKAPDAVSSGPVASAMAVLFIVMASIWLLAQYRGGSRMKLTTAEATFGAFVATCLFSVVGAVNRFAALTETARIVAAVLMFVVLVRMLTSMTQVRRTLIALGIGFAAPLALGLLQAAGGGADFRSADLNRIVGTFLHPNTFGFFLSMFILMAVSVFRHCTRPMQWLLTLAILGCGGMLLLTYSRGAWIALVLGLVIVGILQSRVIFAAMFGCAILALGALPSVLDRVTNLSSSGASTNGAAQNSLFWRFQYWGEIIGLNKHNPITGIGLKGTKYLTDQNKAPHNDFLRAYVETGVLGLVAFLLILVALAMIARSALRDAAPGLPRGIAVGFTAILVAYVLDSLTDNLMSEVVLLWYFYAAAACAFAVARLGRESRADANVSDLGELGRSASVVETRT